VFSTRETATVVSSSSFSLNNFARTRWPEAERGPKELVEPEAEAALLKLPRQLWTTLRFGFGFLIYVR